MLTRPSKPYVTLFGVGFALAIALSACSLPVTPARPRTPVEEGTFHLHKFEQPIGEEKYSVQQDGDELQLSVNFHFNDRGRDVSLDAFVRIARDLVPRSMERACGPRK